MESVGAIQRQRGIAGPRGTPGIADRQQDAADEIRRAGVRRADRIEIRAPRRRRPRHEDRRPRARAADLSVESTDVVVQQRSRFGQRRRTLL